jgi:hypothetical protein
MLNQNPEQIARDHIDKQLLCGWIIQDIKTYSEQENFLKLIQKLSTQLSTFSLQKHTNNLNMFKSFALFLIFPTASLYA